MVDRSREQPDHTHRRRLQRPAGDGQVVLGSTINVPTTVEGAAALQAAGVRPPARRRRPPPPRRGRRARGSARRRPAPTSCAPGDTLSGLAANAGVATSQMAAATASTRGALLDRHRAQAALRRARAARAPPSRRRPSASSPPPRPPRRHAARRRRHPVRRRANGVSPSLAAAIAWQESGFNNGMVSSANARGVMQVMPGTWSYVEQNLAGRRLDPNSATDNVHAGVLYLQHLLAADRRRRVRRDRRLLPGPWLRALARHVRRHAAVRRERAGAALPLRGLR